MTIVYTIACLVALGLLFSVVLYFVAQKFKVEEDPRIDAVEAVLPGANCGGCGNAGCRAFAEKVVKDPSAFEGAFCPVGGNETMEKIGQILSLAVEAREPMGAVVRCSGTCAVRPRTNVYDGYESCRVAAALYTGDTACKWGCIGLGDCVQVCSFNGISIVDGVAVIKTDMCSACGSCVKVCPHGVIELRPKGRGGRRVYVGCLNKDKGAQTRKACTAGCIGCGKCQKACPFDAIHVENNVAYIDFTKCKLCRKCVAECPVHAIKTENFPAPAAQPSPAKPQEQ